MAISIIEDVSIPTSDTNALANELRGARAQTPAKPTPAAPGPNTDSNEPRRFAGKSREDVLEMYLNLERHAGKLANERGLMERQVNELIIDKRARDLAANGAKQPTTVNPTDLLQHPTEALDPFIEERVTRAINPIQQQLARLEGLLGQTVFNANHRDAQDITQSEEFAAWVRETPLRRSIGNLAANGNTQAADELLTEFKKTREAQTERHENAENGRLKAAERVSLEQSRTGNDGTATRQQGKQYTRAQMRALMQSASYANDESLREEVSRAYIEGRVVGN